MEMINEKYNLKNGFVEIYYEGIGNEFNKKLIDNYFENCSFNLVESIKVIRTILRNTEEKILIINYKCDNEFEFIKYLNGQLIEYQKKTKNIFFKYSKDGIQLNYDNKNIKLYEYSSLNEEISEVTKQIYFLNHIKAGVVNLDSKNLIELYKLFYGEIPDFSSMNINVKVQGMMGILSNFNVTLGNKYSLRLWAKDPRSLALDTLVDKLYGFGKLDNLGEYILNERTIKITRIVGEEIRKLAIDSEKLMLISKIIHNPNWCFSNDHLKVAGSCECNLTDVNESVKLIKQLENKVSVL